MSEADTLPPTLAQACDALEAAKEAFFASVEAWLMAELAALSGRVKGRTVTLYSGNGAFTVNVERRRPLAWGDYNERREFVIREGDADGWARWLPAPELFAHMREVEDSSGFQYVAPIGAFRFRDGAALEVES